MRAYQKIMRKIKWQRFVRPMVRYILGEGMRDLVMAEIGVKAGYNAFTMLKTLSIEKIFLVDSYEQYIQGGRQFNYRQSEPAARRKLRRFKSVEFIKTTSEGAAKILPDNLDTVYIDSNHDQIKRDIEIWYPKVRPGGVLGGHDFNGTHQNLVREVIKFADRKRLKLQSYQRDWWIRK